ncbi:MAG: M20/M25/M40 family metallo-hydrolase, partial [Rhodospirillales bacterium]|nr:M20/M25/M40 family metallo-hydrolase [Rhodospirillales bacterium]
MTPTDRPELCAFLAARREAERAFLAELVRVPSDNPPGDCAPHAARTAGLLEGLGFTVERHAVPAELARAHGMISATNLVVRHRFGPGPTIALNAHGDVVPPGEGWTADPYGAEIRDGWMYGRGVAVSKSDIATYGFALQALVQSGLALRGAVELHITYDEESGGEIGPAWLLREGISKPDIALGAGFSYGVTQAHNGALHLEVEVTGRSAHAAKPATGIDALEAATAILAALYAWRGGLAARLSAIDGIGAPQLTVGLISGGINTNVVPDRVTFRLDRRIVPEEQPAAVEAELRAVIGAAAKAFPEAGIGIRRILLATPLT